MCRSLKIVKAIVEVPDPAEIEWHICATKTCAHKWEYVDRSLWPEFDTGKCPHCDEHRFKTVNGHLQPARRCGLL